MHLDDASVLATVETESDADVEQEPELTESVAYCSSRWKGELFEDTVRVLDYEPCSDVYVRPALQERTPQKRYQQAKPWRAEIRACYDRAGKLPHPERNGHLVLVDKGPWRIGHHRGDYYVLARCDLCGEETAVNRLEWLGRKKNKPCKDACANCRFERNADKGNRKKMADTMGHIFLRTPRVILPFRTS